MIELVVFDADGVLFDSYEANIAYYNAIYAALGAAPLDAQEQYASISYSTEQVLRMRGPEVSMLERLLELARTIDPTPFLRMLRPPFELRPFMLTLKSRYKLGLATNRSATVVPMVEFLGLSGMFDAIASAFDKVPHKPAPDILRLCLERAGVEAGRAVYVGDSPIDLEAATAAGMHFIAVGTRVGHERCIGTLDQLPAALENLTASSR